MKTSGTDRRAVPTGRTDGADTSVGAKPRSRPRVAEAEAASAWEPVLEPALEIVDPHVHTFDDRTSNYTLADLEKDLTSGHLVTDIVYVECEWGWDHTLSDPSMAPVREMRQVSRVAQAVRSDQFRLSKAVGHADLRNGDQVGKVLDALAEASSGLLAGVRHGTTWDPSPLVKNHRTDPAPGLLTDPTFRRGFAQLASRNLSFDAWLYHHQLPELMDLARTFPDTQIIVDHLGGPLAVGPYALLADGVDQSWRESIRALSDCPNVAVKLGGLGFPLMIQPQQVIAARGPAETERLRSLSLDPTRTPLSSEELARHWRGSLHWCIEQFGADRCMFESNFPVDRVTASYRVIWNTFKRIARDASPAEKAALFSGTARSVYRIPVAEPQAASSQSGVKPRDDPRSL